jgi:hypothetical protein
MENGLYKRPKQYFTCTKLCPTPKVLFTVSIVNLHPVALRKANSSMKTFK